MSESPSKNIKTNSNRECIYDKSLTTYIKAYARACMDAEKEEKNATL